MVKGFENDKWWTTDGDRKFWEVEYSKEGRGKMSATREKRGRVRSRAAAGLAREKEPRRERRPPNFQAKKKRMGGIIQFILLVLCKTMFSLILWNSVVSSIFVPAFNFAGQVHLVSRAYLGMLSSSERVGHRLIDWSSREPSIQNCFVGLREVSAILAKMQVRNVITTQVWIWTKNDMENWSIKWQLLSLN